MDAVYRDINRVLFEIDFKTSRYIPN